MTNEILSELHYDDQNGSIVYKDVRYLLVRPETIVTFQKEVEAKIGETAVELMFAGGLAGGMLSAARFREISGENPVDLLDFMTRMGCQIGWGKIKIIHFDPIKQRLDIEVVNSAYAEAYGPSKQGVCHFIRGVFAGVAQTIFGIKVEARETKCRAMGDETCHFKYAVK